MAHSLHVVVAKRASAPGASAAAQPGRRRSARLTPEAPSHGRTPVALHLQLVLVVRLHVGAAVGRSVEAAILDAVAVAGVAHFVLAARAITVMFLGGGPVVDGLVPAD